MHGYLHEKPAVVAGRVIRKGSLGCCCRGIAGVNSWKDGPLGLSNKIPRKPQFTAPVGLHGVSLMGTKKPADPGGRAGANGGSLGAQLGVARYCEGVGDLECEHYRLSRQREFASWEYATAV
ncbi:MAG TPA: hypothetical protein DDW55_03935 [Gammaproteobacteria bacterium]|nr:hypothetical protein [Gammaproteobacteria bacterium]